MTLVDFAALCVGHLREHFGGSNAIRMASLSRMFKAVIGGLLLDIAVIDEYVQTATNTPIFAGIDGANQWQHVWNFRSVARFIHSHAGRIAQG